MASKTEEEWNKDWQAALDDPLIPKVWKRNQWCLAEFEGVQVSEGQEVSLRRSLKRGAEIMDADHLGEAMEEAGNIAAKWRRQNNSILPRADRGEQPREPGDQVEGEVSTAPVATRYLTNCQREMSHAAESQMLDPALDAPASSPNK